MNVIVDEYQWNLYKKEHNLYPYNKTAAKKQKVKKRNKNCIKSNLGTLFIYSKETKEYIDKNKKDFSQKTENRDDKNKIEHGLNISYEI